jgi:hypothetical protein
VLKARIGRSPDLADAYALSVGGHLGTGPSMFTCVSLQEKPDPYADPDPGEDEGPTREDRHRPVSVKPWKRR